jgi:3-methyladenine DNA glycosylase Tag
MGQDVTPPTGDEVPREKGAPPQITPKKLDDYLEAMTKSAFQSGISWDVIYAKWPGFKEVFNDFDIEHVADLTPKDVEQLMQDARIIRNRAKIEATIHNAQAIIDADSEYKTFRKYLRSFDDYETLVKNMKKRFKFLGDSGAYIFLYTVKEKVPEYHEWREAHPMKKR